MNIEHDMEKANRYSKVYVEPKLASRMWQWIKRISVGTLSKIFKKIRTMGKMLIQKEEFHGDPQRCEVERSPIKNLGFQPKSCQNNSWKVAKEFGALMVEGIFCVFSNEGYGKYTSHMWNKKDDSYFDVTKDYVFETENFQKELHKEGLLTGINYRYYSCVEYSIEECYHNENGDVDFKFSYEELLAKANSQN